MNENRDLLLMMKDEVVMKINIDEGKYEVVNEKLLPWEMKGKIRDIESIDTSTKYGVNQYAIAMRKNSEAFVSFLSRRVLSLSRENAKKIYQHFGFSQLQDEVSKAKIALVCRAVSLQDNYWVKLEEDKTRWSDVNLRKNSLNEVVAQISLHGSSLSLQRKNGEKLNTPEITGSGAYAKAWKRMGDDLVLLKAGSKDSSESQVEVMCSNLLDKMNVNHLHYWKEYDNDKMVCACKCMTDESLSILPGENFATYCNVNGLDMFEELGKIDPESVHKMAIVDYLLSNPDRHGMNWGLFYDSDTMEIKGCHPLYDHNNAFDDICMEDKDTPYLFNSRLTMKQAAKNAMRKVDFHFTKEIERSDFLTSKQYKSFVNRASELGIEVRSKESDLSIEDILEK